jgi:transposase
MFFIGADIDKRKVHCVLLLEPATGKQRSKVVANTPEGMHQLLAWAQKQTGQPASELQVIMEATGPYHETAAYTLYEAGATVSIVNPKQLKDYAKGIGHKAKNDGQDALALADYGANRRPRPWQPPPPEFRQLHALLQRLEALEKDLQRERNRQEKATVSAASATVLASLARSIAFLEQEKKRLLSEIDGHIDRYPHLRADRDRLLSIPGIGPVLSRWALTLLQHGQRFSSAAQFAAYLGLIPSEHRSGETVYQRPQLSKTGPGHLRAKFYMAAMVAVRYNPVIRAHYERLLQRGKSKMSALGGAMRKLAHICFGVIKNQTNFQTQTPQEA